MATLVFLLGILSAAAIWWYRLKAIRTAAGEAAKAAGVLGGALKRRAARKRAADATLDGIEDPVTAAATMLVAMAADEIPLTPRDEAAIRAALVRIASPDEVGTALDYAKWVNTRIDDPALVIDRLAPLFRARLDPKQRTELLALIDTVKSGITYSSRYDEWRERVVARLDKVN